jgi:hypothetical protein
MGGFNRGAGSIGGIVSFKMDGTILGILRPKRLQKNLSRNNYHSSRNLLLETLMTTYLSNCQQKKPGWL